MTEQIDFTNIIRRIIRQWFLILTISISVSLLAGIVMSHIYKPAYQTQATIVVYGKDYYSGVVREAEETTKLFQEVITSSLLQKRVSEVLGVSSLPGTVSCYNLTNTNMIIMTVSASSPKNAMLVMNGILDNYNSVSERLLDGVVLQVLEEPQVPTSVVAAFDEKSVLMKTFGASVICLCTVMALYFYFRDDIKNENDVEKKLDTKLFATVYHENMNKGLRLPFRKKRVTGLLVTNPVTSFGYIETFQKMCTKVQYQLKERSMNTIILTSVNENEGKSTVAANLALTLAKNGKNVLLVDLDLRKPAQFKLFELLYDKKNPQIGNVLSGKATLENAIRKIDKTNLYILAGNRSYHNSTKMLVKDSTLEMVESMKEEFDYVILDTPPMSMVADAEELMGYADAGLLVVRQNGTRTKDINDAIDIFKSAGCKLLGCVYNDVENGILGNNPFYGDRYNYRYGYGYGYPYRKNYYQNRKDSRERMD